MNLIRLDNAELAYGTNRLLHNADFLLEEGERVALVGRNGTGKSTLLKVFDGTTQLDDGVVWKTQALTISRLTQAVPEDLDGSIFEVVQGGLVADSDAATEWNTDYRVDAILEQLSLPGDLPLSEGSGGIRRRTLLARALISEPQVLLLDEPTNHLDIESIAILQNILVNTKTTLVFVSHDRALIGAVATRIVELDRGKLYSYPGNYEQYLHRKAEAEEIEERANRKFDQELAGEEVWIRQGIKARRTRNEGRVRRLKKLREERSQRVNKKGNVNLTLDAGSQSGNLVSLLDDISFGYDVPLIKHFTTQITRGDRIGIIGPNGSGKSTLIRLILGELEPQSGKVTLGSKLRPAYFDQQRSQIDDNLTVRDNVSPGSDQVTVAEKTRHIVSYLGDFLFPSSYMNMPAAKLSGGEKNRLLMAKLFAQPANLLLLDEPTNDLDVETLELFEELITDYQGTILTVSHDRAFLDAVVTSTMVIGTQGQVREYVGGYSDWQHQVASNNHSGTPSADTDAKPKNNAKKTNNPATKAPRLGFNEKRELKRLPGQIEKMEDKLGELQNQVSAPDFYKNDPDEVKVTLQQLDELAHDIETAYIRWEELSDLET